MTATLFFTTTFLTIGYVNVGFVQGFINKDVSCRARKVLIPIDAPRYQFYPAFVEVFRCDGACSTHSPRIQRCNVASWNNVSGNVYDLNTNSLKVATFQNHTSCICQCTVRPEDCNKNEEFVDDHCECKCKYPDKPPTPCPERYSWSSFECKCVCRGPVLFCSPGQIWSHQACGCVCTQTAVEICRSEKKYLNATTCKCEDLAPPTTNSGPGVTGRRSVTEEMNWERLAAVMVAELIVLVFLFDLYLFWRYEKGVMHWIIDKCHRSTKATSNENASRANGNLGIPNATATKNSGSHDGSPTIGRASQV